MECKKDDAQRKKIIKAAFRLISELGYDDMTTRMVAEKSGISRSLLYYYYRTKGDMLLDIEEFFVEEILYFLSNTIEINNFSELSFALVYKIYLELFESNSKYKNILIAVYSNMDLLYKSTMRYLNNYELSEEIQKLWLFTVGGMSQLFIYQGENDHISFRSILDYTIRAYYLIFGKTSDETNSLLDQTHRILTKEYIQSFILYIEEKTQNTYEYM